MSDIRFNTAGSILDFARQNSHGRIRLSPQYATIKPRSRESGEKGMTEG